MNKWYFNSYRYAYTSVRSGGDAESEVNAYTRRFPARIGIGYQVLVLGYRLGFSPEAPYKYIFRAMRVYE